MKNIFLVAAVVVGCVSTMYGMSHRERQELEMARHAHAVAPIGRQTPFPMALSPVATSQGWSPYQQQVLTQTIHAQSSAKK